MSNWLRKLRYFTAWLKRHSALRRELPKELEIPFEQFKDIRSIDRLQVASWIGLIFTLCLFALDYSRYAAGKFSTHPDYEILFYNHLTGLLFIIPVIHISGNKEWIKETRLRRGVVIWGMVFLCAIFLFSMALIVYWYRGTTTVYMGFVFTASWMFAMSHRERTLFLSIVIGSMAVAIIAKNNLDFDARMVSFIEVFFLTLVAFFIDAFDFNLRMSNFLYQLQIEREQKRIAELESFKSRFFTNLTHEFRTPLTLILGMAKEIEEDPKRWAVEGTQMIQENAGNLLTLVNQILDLSKMESSSITLKMVQADIVSYVGYIVDSFRGFAIAKNIHIHYLCKEDQILMDYDPEQLATIINNLLSNAVKFSYNDDNVYISLSLQKGTQRDAVEITVQDNGIGIPREDLSHIFDRYYQGENVKGGQQKGSGIGLSLTRELVHLFQGHIYALSVLGKGSQFKVTLPVYRTAPLTEPTLHSDGRIGLPSVPGLKNMIQSEVEEDDIDSPKPEVLIIEDNADVLKYLRICLQDLYRLQFAKNGEEGIALAIQNVPDLVISDVLMPVKDGLEVCQVLTKNPVTSHIPIILLSAKTDSSSRIAGLESGADVYMLKPFEKDELRAQIRTLMDRFDEFHARYSNPERLPTVVPETPLKIEDEFITKVRTIVHQHIDDSDFSVHDLERGVFLSRSQLHKKLKALTGMSSMQFVSRIRLAMAREKLQSATDSITDIAYQVGYSDPNYFSRAYSEEFGETPTETRNKFKIK